MTQGNSQSGRTKQTISGVCNNHMSNFITQLLSSVFVSGMLPNVIGNQEKQIENSDCKGLRAV
jgi:hypothetical protein